MTKDLIWPTHPYVPGKNSRHPDGHFDAIRNTVQSGMSPMELAESEAFKVGLRYLDKGFFWEAHEVLEPVWMMLPEDSVERRFVQGLIQLANGFLKIKMGRPKAARRLLRIARDLVPGQKEGAIMSMELCEFYAMLVLLEKQVNLQYNT